MLKKIFPDKESVWLFILLAMSLLTIVMDIHDIKTLSLAGTSFATGSFLTLLVEKWKNSTKEK